MTAARETVSVPTPGERWRRDGLVREVATASGDRVTWTIAMGESVERGGSTYTAWLRWAKRAERLPAGERVRIRLRGDRARTAPWEDEEPVAAAPAGPVRDQTKAHTAREMGITPAVLGRWVKQLGAPHDKLRSGARAGQACFDIEEVRSWRLEWEKANGLRVAEVTTTDRPFAWVKLHGPAKVRCERCHDEGSPELCPREKRLGRGHRAFRRWRRAHQTTDGVRREVDPVLVFVLECGRCWTVLLRTPARRVIGADLAPIRNEKPARQEALFA